MLESHPEAAAIVRHIYQHRVSPPHSCAWTEKEQIAGSVLVLFDPSLVLCASPARVLHLWETRAVIAPIAPRPGAARG